MFVLEIIFLYIEISVVEGLLFDNHTLMYSSLIILQVKFEAYQVDEIMYPTF